MQRRELVKILKKNGFVSRGGSKHEKFCKGSLTVLVKRHTEVHDQEAKAILRQAGIR